jgi:hypothetical protein
MMLRMAAWRANNPERVLELLRASDRRRYQALKRASLGKYETEMNKLKATYQKQGVSMDHIVPIRSKHVSGLNVPWNIQAISWDQNATKTNWFCNEAYQAWRKSGLGPFLRPNQDNT